MAVIITWDQLLTSQRLPSGDVIRMTVNTDYAVNPKTIEFQLASAPHITWEKRIRFFTAAGEIAFLQTKNNIHQSTVAGFLTTQLTTGVIRVEFVKAMAFGQLTGVYELTNFGPWKAKSLRFEWLTD